MSQFDLLSEINQRKAYASLHLDIESRKKHGQYLTPANIARMMAGMLHFDDIKEVRLLDPGAGIGTLTIACIERILNNHIPVTHIHATAFETEPLFVKHMHDMLEFCKTICKDAGIVFQSEIISSDFIAFGVSLIRSNSNLPSSCSFTHAILNPPYFKINSDSDTRRLLRLCGIETSNMYTAFLALSAMLLSPSGRMVSITPRSFCNGYYFRAFRELFLSIMSIERLHVFHSRSKAFKEDNVLQENIIMSARKCKQFSEVIISSSDDANSTVDSVQVRFQQVVNPSDTDKYISIIDKPLEDEFIHLKPCLKATLTDLNVKVSTGRVVDFRNKKYLTTNYKGKNVVPLIYPTHFRDGIVTWPTTDTKKPDAIYYTPMTKHLLIPSESYVLVKRFSAKEERRRVVAVAYRGTDFPYEIVGFENHLNYFHRDGRGLPLTLVYGLTAFLNSSLIDRLFRQFSGHTQVNANDLRKLPYPTIQALEAIGQKLELKQPPQNELDRIVESCIFKSEGI